MNRASAAPAPIALRVTPTTTTSEGTRFAPSCTTVGPSVNEGDQDALLSPNIGTSAEPGEVVAIPCLTSKTFWQP